MGWTYISGATRQQAIADVLQDSQYKNGTWKTLAKTCVGNTLWAVRELTRQGKAPKRYILCALLGKNRGDWGHKDMDESMGPYYYTCPLQFFELVKPETGGIGINPEWRQRVREYQAQEKTSNTIAANLSVGQRFKSKSSGNEFEFIREYSKSFVVGRLVQKFVPPPSFVLSKLQVGDWVRVKKSDVLLLTA